jgi:hypothetical protein
MMPTNIDPENSPSFDENNPPALYLAESLSAGKIVTISWLILLLILVV